MLLDVFLTPELNEGLQKAIRRYEYSSLLVCDLLLMPFISVTGKIYSIPFSSFPILGCKKFRSKHRKRVPASKKLLVGTCPKPVAFFLKGYSDFIGGITCGYMNDKEGK